MELFPPLFPEDVYFPQLWAGPRWCGPPVLNAAGLSLGSSPLLMRGLRVSGEMISLWLQPGRWQGWEFGLPHHVAAGLRPRHMGAFCYQAQRRVGNVVLTPRPRPPPTPAGTETPSPSLSVCLSLDLVPCRNMGQPTLIAVGFLLPLSFGVTALFLVFSYFCACAHKYIFKYFLYVLGRNGSYSLCLAQHLEPPIWLQVSQERTERSRFSEDSLSSSCL